MKTRMTFMSLLACLVLIGGTGLRAADFFWVGGSGNWSDYAHHWATSTGGTVFHGQVPCPLDDVYIDANSFTATGGTLTLDVDAFCKNLYWDNVAGSPVFNAGTKVVNAAENITVTGNPFTWTQSGNINLQGSLYFIPGLTFTHTGTLVVSGTGMGNTITSAGKSFGGLTVNGTGEWTLQDDLFITGETQIMKGSLHLNGMNADFGTQLYALSLDPKTIDLSGGSNTVSVDKRWRVSNATVIAGNSTIVFTFSGDEDLYFDGGNHTYNDVVINHMYTDKKAKNSVYIRDVNTFHDVTINLAGLQYVHFENNQVYNDITINYNCSYLSANIRDVYLYGSNVIHNLKLNLYHNNLMSRCIFYNSNSLNKIEINSGWYVYFPAGLTTYLNEMVTDAGCSDFVHLFSTNTGTQATLSAPAGASVVPDHIQFRDLNATGGATFIATQSIDDGNNAGWTITAPIGKTIYWVGGSGQWNDPTHWSLSSGGAPSICLPQATDYVIFDANSFTASGQYCSLNAHANIAGMTWTSDVPFNPEFKAPKDSNFILTIYHDLLLQGTMTWTHWGAIIIKGSLQMNPGLTWNHQNNVYFRSNAPDNTIDQGGIAFNKNVYFDEGSGTWTLLSDYKVSVNGEMYFNSGNFVSNGYNADFGLGIIANFTTQRSLDFTGTALIRVIRDWDMRGQNLSLNMGTSTLLVDQIELTIYYNSAIYLGSKSYYKILLNNSNATNNKQTSISNYQSPFSNYAIVNSLTANLAGNQYISVSTYININSVEINLTSANPAHVPRVNFDRSIYGTVIINSAIARPFIDLNGSSNFGSLTIPSGATVTFNQNVTQYISSLTANGSCSRLIYFTNGGTTFQSTISSPGGSIILDHIVLQSIKATGGASFTINNGIDLGNNSGWTINAAVPQTYYWTGGTGDWNDAAHWSLISGGPSQSCIPTIIDDAVVDGNSFSAGGGTINLDMPGDVRNFTWTADVQGNPVFSGGNPFMVRNDMYVDGMMVWQLSNTTTVNHNFRLNPDMTWAQNNYVQFYSNAPDCMIDFGGQTMFGIRFNYLNKPPYPNFTMQSDFKNDANCDTYVNGGNVYFGGHHVDVGRALNASLTSSTKSLDFSGTDTVKVREAWRAYDSYVTVNMGSAVLEISAPHNVNVDLSVGNNTMYNDVLIYHPKYQNTLATYAGCFIRNNGCYLDKLTYNSPSSYAPRNLGFYNNGSFGDVKLNIGKILEQIILYGTNQFANFELNNTNVENKIFPILIQASQYSTGTFRISGGFDCRVYQNADISAGQFILGGNCKKLLTIRGDNAATSRLIQTSGTATADWVTLKDHTATGGATFIATNATLTGSVSGWTTQPDNTPYNLYWVGGSGSWHDPGHWSFSSGGTPNGCIIPKAKDNVIFDENSFTETSKTVTYTANYAECNNMIWKNTTVRPFFSVSYLSVFGDVNVSIPMDFNTSYDLHLYKGIVFPSTAKWYHNGNTYFNASTTGNIIDMGGNQFISNVYFNGSGQWILGNQFLVVLSSPWSVWTTTFFEKGNLISNGYAIRFGGQFNSMYDSPRNIDLSGSTVNSGYAWQVNPSQLSLNMSNTTLLLSAVNQTIEFNGGGLIYYNMNVSQHSLGTIVNFHGSNTIHDLTLSLASNAKCYANIYDNSVFNSINIVIANSDVARSPEIYFFGQNSINNFTFLSSGAAGPFCYFYDNNTFGSLNAAGKGTRLFLGSGKTQTVNDFVLLGTGNYPALLFATTEGVQANVFKSSGQVCFDYVWLRDINATGGASFNAGASSQNIGNSTGWSFTTCTAYYWVGGTGNWNDLNHWATNSGGTQHPLHIPTQYDNVYFDANSFTAANQTVTLNIPNPVCNSMDWSTAMFSPKLAGTATQFDLYGSLQLNPNMNLTWNQTWAFRGGSGDYTLDASGKSLNNVSFLGPGGGSPAGSWALANDLIVNSNINLYAGSLATDNFNVLTRYFNILTGDAKSLDLGSSDITISNGQWNAADVSALTFDPGTSNIILYSTGTSCVFNGGGLTYHDLSLTPANVMNATINGSNTFNTLLLQPGSTLSLQAGSTQTVNELVGQGTCVKGISIHSTEEGTQAIISKTAGSADLKFVTLQDIAATGGAAFNANLSIDDGNVTGWNFTFYPEPALDITSTNAHCPLPNDGTATAIVSSGTPPMTYTWSTLESVPAIYGLTPGWYGLTVTDLNGCVAIGTVQIVAPPSYQFGGTVTASQPLCYGTTDGTMTANPGAAAALPLSYLWNNAGTTQTISNLGAGTYSVTMTDAAGCLAGASGSINMQSSLDPTITPEAVTVIACQDIVLSGNATGSIAAWNWDFGDGTTASGQEQSHAYPIAGTYNVSLSVTSVTGCEQSASALITVEDNQPPQLVCPEAITLENTPGSCGAVATYNVTASDNCPVQLTVQPPSGSFFGLGTHTVVATATDPTGNSSTCNFTVTVHSPEILVSGNGVSITDGDNLPVPDDGTDFGQPFPSVPVTHSFVIENSGTSPLSITTLEIEGPQASNFTTGGIGLPLVLEAGGSTSFTLTFVAAPLGIYNAMVSIGNSDCDEGTFDFAVKGEVSCQPASFTSCPDDITATTDEGLCTALVTYDALLSGAPLPSVTYSFSGATTANGDGTGSGSAFEAGVTTVTLTATNACGQDDCSFTVTVGDVTPPTAICQNVTVTLNSAGMATLSAEAVDNGSWDACGIKSMTLSNTSFTCADLAGNPHNVTLTVTDENENVSSCLSQVTVNGVLPSCVMTAWTDSTIFTANPPDRICLGYGPDTVFLNVAATGGGPFTYTWSGWYLTTNGPDAYFHPSDSGTYELKCTVTNAYGCQSSCSVTFCVLDIRDGWSNGEQKVLLCHERHNNPITLSIGVSAVPGHLLNHPDDRLGRCGQACDVNVKLEPDIVSSDADGVPLSIMIYPNPFSQSANFGFIIPEAGTLSLRLVDISGRIFAEPMKSKYVPQGKFLESFNATAVPAGVYSWTAVLQCNEKVYHHSGRFVITR